MYGAIAGLIVGVIIAIAVTIPVGIYLLAKLDIFFTIVREAEAKAVMKGDQFVRFVYSLEDGYRLNKKTWEVEVGNIEEGWLQRNLGIVWVGIPPFLNIYHYKMIYSSRIQVEKDGQAVFVAKKKEEEVSSIFLRDDVYVSTMEGPETKEHIPVNVIYVMVARSVNPYKSLFRVQHWLEAVHGLIEQAGRDYVGQKMYEDLIEKESTATSSPEGLVAWLTAVGITKRLEDEYGIKVSSVDITAVETIGALAKEFVEATTREYVAKQEAIRKIEEAKGEAKAIKLVSDAIRKGGEAGTLAIQTRTLGELAKGQATKIFIPSGVMDILSKFGDKK